MKKKLLALLLIAVVLSLSLTAFTACNNKDEGQPENVTSYAIPSDLAVSVGIYDNETLVCQITKDTLSSLTQYRVTMTTVNDYDTEKTVTYIGYKVTDAVEKLGKTLPAFTKVKSIASDDYEGEYEISTLANAYITIGQEEDGKFATDKSSPRFLSDCKSTSSNSVAKYISKIVLNPVTVTVPDNTLEAIAAADKYVVPTFEIDVNNGEDDLVVINSSALADKTQYKVAIYESATSYKEYVGFKLADLLEAPATITAVKAASTKCEITSIDNSLIIFAKYDETTGADITLGNSPRFIPDYTTAVNTDDIVKNATTIVFNPIAAPAATATEAYTIELSWSETNLALTAVIYDKTDPEDIKDNTIVISTTGTANTIANVDDKSIATAPRKSDIDLGANKKISYTSTGKSPKTYYGYDLKTILAAMQFKNKNGEAFPVIDAADYDYVGWICSDDDLDTDYTARAYTKAEITANVISVVFDSGNTVAEGQTRIFSDLADTDPATYRNKCKNVLTLVLYKAAD